MKRLLTLVLAAMAFVACTQNDVEELTDNRVALPETITGGFEGGDTRIELNEALKTVWTEGDEVSVFYRSYENMRWAFQGETGDRSGELRLVSGEAGEQTMDNVVVVYPYSETYVIDITDGYVEASLPAVQSYKEGSYGAEGNIMVAESDYRQFTLKSVVGWLRVELTGEGESVKSITLRGNAGEQLAGDILVNAADASCILASEGAAAEDNSEVAGNLMLEESILTEITLNCGSGVMLGSEAKSFYIALLPQTFEQGITVEVECGNGTSTTKSTAGKFTVERNHIVPMASFKYDGVLPEVYELAYTTNDGKPLDPYTTEGFGGEFMENIYDAATGRGVLKFAGAITPIPEHAFAICENLTWIDIPEGITTIGASAFTGCTALEELTIPSTLTSLGSEAFQNCSFKATINCDNVSFQGVGFTEVIIGDSVTTIGNYAFNSCVSLTSVTIGNSVTSIGYGAFVYCHSLTSVHITDVAAWCNISFGDYPLSDGADLYLNNELVTELTIPDSVTTIGGAAFYGCNSLTSVTIPDSVTTIGESAFCDCRSLTSVTIPDSVTTIGGSAFEYCNSLTSVTIGDSVTSIGNYAFRNCDSLTSVYCKATTPPAGGLRIVEGTSATIYVPEDSLREYKMAENWSEYADYIVGYNFGAGEEGVVNSQIFYTATALVEPYDATAFNVTIVSNEWNEATGEGVITFDGELTTIGNYAFEYCDSLTSVTIPDSVTTIGDYAFYWCHSLTNVTIPDGVTTIGKEAFGGCANLTSVTIGDSVTTIGEYAFGDCESLTSVTIGDSVTMIGFRAFEYCDSLTSVTIPDSVTWIGWGAFEGCSSLTSVTIGDSVTMIEDGAFYGCSSLTSVTIPDSVTTIEHQAFSGCGNLTSVTIGDSVMTIGSYAFSGCGLTSVTIPDSVTTIGGGAFAACHSLAEFKGKFAADGGRCLIKDNTLIAYANVSGTTYTIPDSVTTIGDYAFEGCSSLTSVTIPDSVTAIGDWAFHGCSSLTSVTIGDSVTTIGNDAFFDCYNLTNVYCKATTPPTLGCNVFKYWDEETRWEYVNIGCPIYVPAESVEAYKAAEYWSEYADYIVGYNFETGEEIPETPETPETPSDFVPTHTATKWLWSGASNYGNKYVVSGDDFTIDVHFPTSVATESSLTTGEYVWMVTSFFSNSDATNFTTRSFKLGGSDDTVPISEGSAKVTASGDTYTIQLTLVHRDSGYEYMIEYVGKLNDAGEAVPDDVVMDVVSVLAKMRTDGKVWDLILIENDYTMGEPMTQITVEMGSANMKYITSGTYSTLNSNGILPGTVNTDYGEWSNSVYRYNTILQEAIEDCELTIAVDEATQTAAISGYLVSKQIDDETGRTFDVNVIFEWNGPVEGFRWEDPTDGITDWKTFSIFAEFDDCKCIKGVSNGGNEVAIYLHTLGATKADALAAGTYPVADWVYTTTANYCETVATKVNGSEITSGSVTVEGGGDNYTVRFELSDGSNTYKGVYTGAL